AQAAPNTFSFMCSVAMVSYGVSKLGMTQAQMLIAISIGAASEMLTIPLYGWLADRVARRKIFVWGMLVLLASVFPFVMAVEAKSYEGIVACYVLVMAVGHAACHASQASLFSDMFPTSVRYTGISAGYQTSGTIFAGPLPMISAALISAAGGGVRLFFAYVFAAGVVSLVAIMVS